MRREGRIPHRRLCHEVITVREGVSGEIMNYCNYSYDKLEPAEARTNASKIKGPARVVAHGKQYWPREKCLGKSKGERKKRDKCCVLDSRYTDPTLVDPEHPSSWKARQISGQLSDSDEMNNTLAANVFDWAAEDCNMSDDYDRSTSKVLGGLSAAMQSLTDSTHWPKYSQEPAKMPTAIITPPMPISSRVLLHSSSEDWELGVSATSSDASSLCNAGLTHLPDMDVATRTPASPSENAALGAEIQDMQDGEESEWDMLSASGSDWDIVSEVDMDAC